MELRLLPAHRIMSLFSALSHARLPIATVIRSVTQWSPAEAASMSVNIGIASALCSAWCVLGFAARFDRAHDAMSLTLEPVSVSASPHCWI